MSSLAHCLLDSSLAAIAAGPEHRSPLTPAIANPSQRAFPVPIQPQAHLTSRQAAIRPALIISRANGKGSQPPAGCAVPPLPAPPRPARPPAATQSQRGISRPEPTPGPGRGGSVAGSSVSIGLNSERWGAFPGLWPLGSPDVLLPSLHLGAARGDAYWMAVLLLVPALAAGRSALASAAVSPLPRGTSALEPLQAVPMPCGRGVAARPWLAMTDQPFEQACSGVGPSIYPTAAQNAERLLELRPAPPFDVVITNAKCPDQLAGGQAASPCLRSLCPAAGNRASCNG